VSLWLLCATQGKNLRRREFDRAAMAFLIHDAGMVKIPAFITNKTSPLKPDEKDKIPPHPIIAMKTAQKLEIVTDEMHGIILEHHEHLDGSRYPQKLSGEATSRLGHLSAVADFFAAMIQNRPYAEALAPVDAAKSLAGEKSRYDTRFTTPLMTAYVVNDFSFR
jgi:HD-GYP domain-containing protein (c-di-GMP phosphodiesterase class II)